MNDIICEIEKKCHEKVMVYHDLLGIFRKEKKSIVSGDVSALWRFSSEKNEKAKKIEAIRREILDLLTSSGIQHEITIEGFELEAVINLFSGSDLKELTECLVTVNRLKKQIKTSGKANLQFIEEYLEAINDIVNVFVGASRDTNLYNRKRNFSEQRDSETVLIRREV